MSLSARAPAAPRPDDEGTKLVLTKAGDVDTLVRAHGTRFAVTNRSGDVTPAGARELGFFHDDTRYLSHYELSIGTHALVRLSSNASDHGYNRIDLMLVATDEPEFLDDPQNFLHVRRRQLVDDCFRENIELVNFLQRTIHIEVVVAFAADFADVFEIRGATRRRRGRACPAHLAADAVELSYDGLEGLTYATRLAFSPPPTVLDERRAVFRLAIAAGESATIDVTATPQAGKRTAPRKSFDFDGHVRVEREAAARFFEESTRFRCDNAALEHVLSQSAADLRSLAIGVRGHRVLAAGIPWFCCPFGRDTLIAAYEALTFNPELAVASLRVLAEFQGTKFDPFTEEEPGKIFHELRFGEMARCREIPHSPYYGSIDATPLFLVVAHAAFEATGDLSFVAELERPLRAALAWIDRRSEHGSTLVTYARISERGLDNQGWKDSRAGVSFPDGRRAEPPIALCEVQGYCLDAYRRGARLLAVLGDEIGRATYAGRAETFAEVVDRAFWLRPEGRYAFAVDGAGRALPTVVSNLGHLLWSRVATPEQATATADLLVEPASLSPFGIRTLASGQPIYNPLSYHNGTVWPHDNALVAKGFAQYGLMDHACQVFQSLANAMVHFPDRRLPELFCGTSGDGTLVRYPVACSPQAWAAAAPYLLLQAVLGLELDGPNQRLWVNDPHVPGSFNRLDIEGLRVGRSRVTLRLRRSGRRCHVDRLDVVGAPLRVDVAFEARQV